MIYICCNFSNGRFVIYNKSTVTKITTKHTCKLHSSWLRHDMEALSALQALCEGNPPVTGGFPSQRASDAGFDAFFGVILNKTLNKQYSYRWFETLWHPLWRHSDNTSYDVLHTLFLLIRQGKRFSNHTGWFPSQRASDAELWYFFVVSLNKLLSEQSIVRSYKTPWHPFDVTVKMSPAF